LHEQRFLKNANIATTKTQVREKAVVLFSEEQFYESAKLKTLAAFYGSAIYSRNFSLPTSRNTVERLLYGSYNFRLSRPFH